MPPFFSTVFSPSRLFPAAVAGCKMRGILASVVARRVTSHHMPAWGVSPHVGWGGILVAPRAWGAVRMAVSSMPCRVLGERSHRILSMGPIVAAQKSLGVCFI